MHTMNMIIITKICAGVSTDPMQAASGIAAFCSLQAACASAIKTDHKPEGLATPPP